MQPPSAQQPIPAPPAYSVYRTFDRWLVAFFVFVGVLTATKFSAHQVPEGHVGVYWRGGRLLETTTPPGFRFKLPIDKFAPIQVTIQTDEVTDVPCGTKGGVVILFRRVEVVNRLRREYVHDTILEYGVHYDKAWIYDKLHHELNQFCSKHSLQDVYIDKFDQVDEILKEALQADCDKYAPGIEVIAVRLTKPSIPPAIMANYERMEEERTKVAIAQERERVVTKEAEIESLRAVMQAEKEARTSRILMEQRLAEKEARREQQAIENAIFISSQAAAADAEHYRAMREAEANQGLLTPAYLQQAYIHAVANNTKLFFGNKLPTILTENWAL